MKESLTEEALINILKAFDKRIILQEATIESLVDVIIEHDLIDADDFGKRVTKKYELVIKEREEELDKIESKLKVPTYYGPTGEA